MILVTGERASWARTWSTRCSRRVARCACSTRCSRTPSARPICRRRSISSRETCAMQRRSRRALRGVEHVCHQAGMVGLATIFSTSPTTSARTIWAPRCSCASSRKRPPGRLVLASSMVVYGEGGYECAEDGIVPPGAAPRREPGAGTLRTAVPAVRRGVGRLGRQPRTRRWILATSTPRRRCTRASRVGLSAGERSAGHGAAVPQRLWPGSRATPPMPGSRRSSPAPSPAARRRAVFEDGLQLRDFVHVRDVVRATYSRCSPRRRCPALSTSQAVSLVASASWRTRSPNGDSRSLSPKRTGEYRRGDVRHVVRLAERAARALASARRRVLRRACASSRPRRCVRKFFLLWLRSAVVLDRAFAASPQAETPFDAVSLPGAGEELLALS